MIRTNWLAVCAVVASAAALALISVPRAHAQDSYLHIYGTGTASTSAHVTITEGGAGVNQATLCPDRVNVYSGGSITYWGPGAICGAPLAEKIISFRASFEQGHVLLTWSTASEACIAGFHVRRQGGAQKAHQRITKALIPQLGSELAGATYTYQDWDVQPTVDYAYLLELVKNDGTSELFGPIRPVVDKPKATEGATFGAGGQPGASAARADSAKDQSGGCAVAHGAAPDGLPLLLLLLVAWRRQPRQRKSPRS